MNIVIKLDVIHIFWHILQGEGDTHEYVYATNIIGLSLIWPETYKEFKDKLKECHETYKNKRNKR